jgi:hypothetical protein
MPDVSQLCLYHSVQRGRRPMHGKTHAVQLEHNHMTTNHDEAGCRQYGCLLEVQRQGYQLHNDDDDDVAWIGDLDNGAVVVTGGRIAISGR